MITGFDKGGFLRTIKRRAPYIADVCGSWDNFLAIVDFTERRTDSKENFAKIISDMPLNMKAKEVMNFFNTNFTLTDIHNSERGRKKSGGDRMEQKYKITIEALSLNEYEFKVNSDRSGIENIMDAFFESNMVSFNNDDVALITFTATDAEGTAVTRYAIRAGEVYSKLTDEMVAKITSADSPREAKAVFDEIVKCIVAEAEAASP